MIMSGVQALFLVPLGSSRFELFSLGHALCAPSFWACLYGSHRQQWRLSHGFLMYVCQITSVFYFSISIFYFSILLQYFSILLQYSDRPTSSNSVLPALWLCIFPGRAQIIAERNKNNSAFVPMLLHLCLLRRHSINSVSFFRSILSSKDNAIL